MVSFFIKRVRRSTKNEIFKQKKVLNKMEVENHTNKILFIGDPHFKIKNVEYIPLFTSRIVGIIESNELDFVVVAGDLLDNHDRVDVEPLNLAINFIDSIRKLVKTFVLVGNHDYKNNQQFLSNNHWMNALKWWDNVTIVDDVIEHDNFLFVPYVPPGRFVEAIETKFKKPFEFKALFAHQEFYGCKMGPIESKHGDKWNLDWPLVVSGHIHSKQWPQPNIYYPGSAMQHAFGQSTGNTISLLVLDNQELICEEIDLKMPKLVIKYMSINDVLKPLKFKLTQYKKYKIILQGTQEEFQAFKKNLRYKELLAEGYKIVFKLKNMLNNDLNIPKKNFIDVLHKKIVDENDDQLNLIYKKFITR
jgi:predicted phosphodiesterase